MKVQEVEVPKEVIERRKTTPSAFEMPMAGSGVVAIMFGVLIAVFGTVIAYNQIKRGGFPTWGLPIFALSLPLIFFGISKFKQAWHEDRGFEGRTRPTDGRILDKWSEDNDDSVSYFVIYEFQPGSRLMRAKQRVPFYLPGKALVSAKGKNSLEAILFEGIRVGMHARIRYLPEDPQMCRMDEQWLLDIEREVRSRRPSGS